MEGKFHKSQNSILAYWILICGVCLIALSIFLSIVDEEADKGIIVLLLFGIVLCLIALPLLFLNRRAYISLSNDAVRVRYHLFGRLDCSMEDIAYALPQLNALTLILKNGKLHTVMGIENSWELASYIRRRTFALESVSPHELRLELDAVRSARKKELARVIVLIVLMFLFIILAVIITDGKDMPDFDRADWVFFYIMMGLCILSAIGTFYFAGRCGSHLIPIELLNYRLRSALIAFEPLPTGNVKFVFTDPDYYSRVICYALPNSLDCYYCIQNFAGGTELVTEYSSEVFSNFDELMEELAPVPISERLVDITYNFT